MISGRSCVKRERVLTSHKAIWSCVWAEQHDHREDKSSALVTSQAAEDVPYLSTYQDYDKHTL